MPGKVAEREKSEKEKWQFRRAGGGFGAMETTLSRKRSESSEEPRVPPKKCQISWEQKRLDQDFPYFRKPAIIGSFSLDAQRRFVHDRRQLRYLAHKIEADQEVKFNLNTGLAKVVTKNEDETHREGLRSMLDWIMLNKSKFELAQRASEFSLNTDFVCYRGLLTCLMCTPYEAKDRWVISARKYKGTVYLLKEETPEGLRQRKSMSEKQKTMCIWGYKFEQHLMSDRPGVKPDPHAPLNTNEEFCCMFRTRLGTSSVVYGAEMDGVESAETVDAQLDLNRLRFIELKTSRRIEHSGHSRTFAKFKLIKWWAQSFLVAIPKVICGFRDDAGIVHQLKTYPIYELPKMGAEHWQPNVCMNFLNDFLEFAKTKVTNETQVFQFSWEPGFKDVQVKATDLPLNHVLPESYVHQFAHQPK
eukprot:snap_masked-scaffold344_size201325-processed-gene-1.0 protein:Tk02537 transcript:snap_masked-scaffold344_size201325-processed-gene-1.0-mRNA-1 annotation:"protein dom3z"